MPDIVYMKLEGKTNGKQTGPVINEYGESLASGKIGSIGSTSKATAGEVRGSGRSQAQGQGAIGGTPTGVTGADSGVLPRGFDSVVETIRSASDIQLKSMGLTVAEKKKFLDRFDNPFTPSQAGSPVYSALGINKIPTNDNIIHL